MDHYRESYPGLTKSASLRMEGAKSIAELGNNRRVLGDIDINNFIRVRPPSPSRVAKRGISENSCIEAKNKVDNRPVTRRFAASLANKSALENHNPRAELIKNEKHKNTMTTFPNPTGFESFTVIDLDEDVEVSPLPSFVKHTEAMLEEMESLDNFELEEVEMAEIEEEDEPVPDIDSGDKRNPLATVEYVEEIYSFYRSSEGCSCVRPNYMSNQSDINEKMRAILIDWLIEVHYKFELMDETLFLTVNLIDRFLERQFVVRKKLQLVGVTAMLLACKYEEVTVPVVDDLILISDRAYSREEVLAMEKLMVNTLQFHISVPTPYVFLRRFLKAAQADKKLELLTFFMIELCLVEYGMLKYPPSLLAAGAVYTALCTLNRFKHWSRACQWHTNYTEDQLLECSGSMVNFHQKAATGKLTGVHKKYSTFRFGYAARAEPAQFLLQATL